MHVKPEAPRYTVEYTPEGLRAVIPARRSGFTLIFLSAWLVGWAFGEVQASAELLSPSEKTPSLFLAAWLAAWTVGGTFAIGALLWQIAGREILFIDGVTLAHRVEALGIGRTRAYQASEVRNLRVTDYSTNPFSNQMSWFPPVTGSGYGPLAFDYGARTFRLAPGIEAAEARLLMAQLLDRLPRRLDEN